MKLTVTRAAARSAAFVAVVARLFLALAVDAPTTHNGAWLCPLIAALPMLPWAICAEGVAAKDISDSRFARAPLIALLLIATLLDGASVLSCVARSAGSLALDRVPTLALALPVALAALWGILRNGDAIGYAAMIRARLFPALLGLVILLQARHYRPQWLLPLLGSGWRGVADGGLRGAGLVLPASAILLVAEDAPDAKSRMRTPTAALVGAALTTTLLLLLALMMTPTPSGETAWLQRLDAVLTNGRAPLYLQLPMITGWYAGLLHLLTCECFAGAALLQRLLPGARGKPCASGAVAAVFLLSAAPAAPSLANAASRWLYVAAAPLTVLAALLPARAKGGDAPCS